MKKTILSAFVISLSFLSFAQTDINLNLEHLFDGEPFSYGTTYMLDETAVEFSRVQYYLSGFEIIHDGGTVTSFPDSYVLASGNVSNYTIENDIVENIEEINFDLGVDYDANHFGSSNWPSDHPLAPQSPLMDWGWPSGYFFWVLIGKIDNTGDGVPNKTFELKGLGDVLLRDVDSFTGLNAGGGEITLPFQVNIADWVRDLALATVGADHGAGPDNVQLANNTNIETVFTISSTVLSIENPEIHESRIYANYEFAYAPTIFYDLGTNKNVNIKVYSLDGRVVLESPNESPEGNYFIRKELETGTYVIVFTNDDIEESLKFMVQK